MQDESLNSAFYQDADLTIHLAFQVSGCKCPFNARKLNRVIVILSSMYPLRLGILCVCFNALGLFT